MSTDIITTSDSDLQRVKNYLRIDTDLDDADILMNIATARQFLKNAVGSQLFSDSLSLSDEEKEMINQEILMHVSHLYSSQVVDSESKGFVMPYGMQALILQIRANYLVYTKELSDGEETDEN